MLIVFSISLVGHMLVHRIINSLAQEFALSEQIVHRLLILNLALFGTLLALPVSATTLWVLIGIPWISLNFFPIFLRFFLIRRLRSALIPFLDCVILSLQSGKSFRISLFLALENQVGWIQNQLREVVDSLQMSENVTTLKSALLNDLRREIVEIDRSQNRCVEQVKALRRELKMNEDFRRRSGQVTQQIKMQAIIVTALYLALASFVIVQFGFTEHRKIVLSSSAIFICGLVWIFSIGRRMKWKV